MEVAAEVGDGEEGGEKYGGDGMGAGYSVQVSPAVGVLIWEIYFFSDGVHAKNTIGIPSSISKKDYGDDGVAYWRICAQWIKNGHSRPLLVIYPEVLIKWVSFYTFFDKNHCL